MTTAPTYPSLLSQPFASGSGPNFGGKNVIPTASVSPAASLADGFPNVTMLPLLAGGVPPSGQDMNGILNAITQHTVWLNAGGEYVFSAALAAAIGGYGIGAVLQSASNPSVSWVNLCANNSTNPDSGPFAITASCATNVLTVTATAGILQVGQQVSGVGIPLGTTIISFGTGTGGNGTYNLSTIPGTVASESMTAFGWLASSGSFLAAFGAAVRTQAQKNADCVTVTDFPGVDPTGTNDSSAGIQKAINSGRSIIFPDGTYLANNLTASTSGQRLIGMGFVQIKKNANGPILTISAPWEFELNGLKFMGDASTPTLTGHNIVFTSAVQNARCVNTGSMWAYGRALLFQGVGQLEIIGSNPIWQTADVTGTGYDIEIGVSGTASLYHHLENIESSQSTGGVLMTDTGAATIMGGAFGKLSTMTGTAPAGSGGPKIIGARIKGVITVDQSNTTFSGCQIAGNMTVTANCGSGVTIDETTVWQLGTTLTNNGGGVNIIRRNIGAGAAQLVRFGGDSSNVTQEINAGSGPVGWHGTNFFLDNNQAFQQINAGATAKTTLVSLVGTALYLGDSNSTGCNTTALQSFTVTYFNIAGATKWQVDANAFKPSVDNAVTLGNGTNRPSQLYAATATINTSDAREKTDVVDSPLGLAFINALRPVSYRWIVGRNQVDVVEPAETDEEGHLVKEAVIKVTPVPGNRTHYGLLAQEVKAALDSAKVGDCAVWTQDDPSNPESRQGLRYEELMAPLIKAVQELSARLDAKGI